MNATDSVTPRAVPFYCPFCGEQDIRPEDPSGYRCEVCDRRWDLRLLGVGPGAGEPAGGTEEATR